MKTNVVFLSKKKLIGIDAVLPLLMEIKSRYPDVAFHVVYPDRWTYGLTHYKNYHVRDILYNVIKPAVTICRGKNRVSNFFRALRILWMFSFQRTIFLKYADPFPSYPLVMRFLRFISTSIEIKVFLDSRSLDSHKNVTTFMNLIAERSGKKVSFHLMRERFDYFLSSLSAEQCREVFGEEADRLDANKIIKTGYYRKFPRWAAYLSQQKHSYRPINQGNYFFYVLSIIDRRRDPHLDEPPVIELVEETLSVLKKYNHDIKTVFRFHPNFGEAETNRIMKLLVDLGYSNYCIDDGHAMVLASKAKFVVNNVFSTTMFDAYYQGIPVVEYADYDPRLYERLGKQSMGGGCCDFFIRRDKDKLDRLIDDLVHDRIRIKRNPHYLAENFPETSAAFWDFWDQLLLNKSRNG
jgi:hypothetical protein